MNGSLQKLLAELKEGLAGLYGDRLQGVYLYGSYARGDFDEESDVDLLIVLDQVIRYGQEIERTGCLISNLSIKYEISVSRVFVSVDDWRGGGTPFLVNVREDAVPAFAATAPCTQRLPSDSRRQASSTPSCIVG